MGNFFKEIGEFFEETVIDPLNEHVIDPILDNPIAATVGAVTGGLAFAGAGQGAVGATLGATAGAAANANLFDNPDSSGSGNGSGMDTSVFEEDFGVDIDAILELGQQQTEQNLRNFPRLSDAALDNALRTAPELDAFMSERFFRNLEAVLPNFQETIIDRSERLLDTVTDITESQLAGEVPQDVQDFIIRTRAEQGISQGLFGEAASFATARDLGRTSLDLQQQGIQNTVGAVSPLTQNLLNFTFRLQPPVSDPTAIFGQGLGALAGTSLVSAGQAVQTGLASQQFNQDLAYSQALGQLNFQQQQQQLAIQQQQFAAAQDAAQTNSILNLVGITAGAFLGGPAGAFLGNTVSNAFNSGQTFQRGDPRVA